MSLTGLSPLAFFAGLGAIAGALFLLQRLTVRHRELPVVTTLFWHEAVEETRARVLVQRFRHPLVYAFLLAIGAALWFALAGPRFTSEGERDYVLLLDGSAASARAGSFADSVQALEDAVRALPRDQTTVLYCGGETRTLLAPGEERVLLGERLTGLAPENAPATIEAELVRLARTTQTRPARALIFGHPRLRQDVLALLPDSLEVRRMTPDPGPLPDNVGLTALGASAAASGRWNAVDVLVEVRGTALDAQLPISASLNGAPVAARGVRELDGDRVRVLLADLPASGGQLEIRLDPTDGFGADDVARFVLPDRPPIRVALSPALAPLFGPVLAADSATTVTQGTADVAIRRAGEAIGAGLPALEFAPQAGQQEAFLVRHDAGGDSNQALSDALEALGLYEIDAPAIAQSSGQLIAVGAAPGATRGVSVWDVLLAEEHAFLGSRAFPLFVAKSLRWLAATPEIIRAVPAGTALAGRSVAHVDATETLRDPAGVAFTPPRAGTYRGADGRTVAAALLDPELTVGSWETPATGDAELGESAGLGAVTWILLLALAGLVAEWHLHRTGRIP